MYNCGSSFFFFFCFFFFFFFVFFVLFVCLFWGRKGCLLYLSLVCGMSIVCHGVFGLSLGVSHHENMPFDPLKPHFHIVKLGFTGVYIIFLIPAHKHRLWVLV